VARFFGTGSYAVAEPIVLVCMLADYPSTVPGSTFEHSCSHCDRRLMMAPSGQGFMREHPEAVKICFGCYRKIETPDDEWRLAGSKEQVLREISTSVPNDRRNRN
jgi:hypothetical protein